MKNCKSLSDGGGLYLQMTEKNQKYWRYKYRINKKEKVIALGVYPEVTLAEVRGKHRDAHKLVSKGVDPMEAKKQAKLQR